MALPACRSTTSRTCSVRSLLLAARSLKSSGWPRRKTGMPAILMSTRAGSNFTPARPAAAKMRPQFGSPPAKAVFTSGDVARGGSRLRMAHFDFDHALRAFAISNDLQGERAADFFERSNECTMRRRSSLDRWRAGFTVRENEQRVVRRSVAIHADRVERASCYFAQRPLQQGRSNRRVCCDEGQHRRHVGMDHSRALGAADEMNPFPGHLERRGRGFRACVGRADRKRSFRERTGRGTAMPRNDWQRTKNFLKRHLHADHSCGANKKLLRRAPQPLRGFRYGTLRGGVARRAGGAVGVAGVYHHGAHAAFGRAQVLFRNKHGCGNDKVLREDRGSRSWNIARKNREIERASFLQAASSGGEAEPARQGGFRKCVLHQRKIRRTSAPAPEGTSDPPQPQRGRIVVSLPGLHS